MDLGCLAAQSVARLDQTVAWVAHDGKVYRLQGYAGKRISTPSVGATLKRYLTRAPYFATSWTRGSRLYQISSESWTWVYDSVYGWSNRKSYNADRWRVSTVTKAFNKVICGDQDSPNFYGCRKPTPMRRAIRLSCR